MSRASSRRRQQQRAFPWPVLMFAGVLLIGAAILLAVNPFAPRAGNVGSGNGGTPQIAVDPQRIDYGYVQFGNDKSFTIKVTNNGSGVLSFNEKPYVEVLEGC